VSTKRWEGAPFWKATHQGIVGRWRSTSTIWRATSMIDEEGLYIWIWPWILAQLVLPVETMTQWDKHEVSPPFRNKKENQPIKSNNGLSSAEEHH